MSQINRSRIVTLRLNKNADSRVSTRTIHTHSVPLCACPILNCEFTLPDSANTSKQRIRAHINEEIRNDPSIIYTPSVIGYMRAHGLWFCTSCCGLFSNKHKGSHARPAESQELIIVTEGKPAPPRIQVPINMHVSQNPISDLHSPAENPQLDFDSLFQPLTIYPDLEIRIRMLHVPIVAYINRRILITMFTVCVLRRAPVLDQVRTSI